MWIRVRASTDINGQSSSMCALGFTFFGAAERVMRSARQLLVGSSGGTAPSQPGQMVRHAHRSQAQSSMVPSKMPEERL